MRSRRLFNWVSSWYALGTSVEKNLPAEYASTTNASNRYQEHLADQHRDPGPRQFTMDCRSPARHRVAAAINYASLVPAGRIPSCMDIQNNLIALGRLADGRVANPIKG